MRLTKDIKNRILANILRDHEIATEAKSIMMDSRALKQSAMTRRRCTE